MLFLVSGRRVLGWRYSLCRARPALPQEPICYQAQKQQAEESTDDNTCNCAVTDWFSIVGVSIR